MKHANFESMSVDELWTIHEQIGQLLVKKIDVQKKQLEKTARQAQRGYGFA